MDIEVGDYVRTNDGLIFKIFTKTKTTYGFCGLTDSSNKKYSTYTYGKGNCIDNNIKGKIVKHSKNIINLIEPGDFVNGREVKHIAMFEGFPNYPKLIFVDEKRLIPDDTCENDEIKTILTKEQYSQNCYAVERS